MWALAVELSHSRPEWLAKTYGCFTADFTLYTQKYRETAVIFMQTLLQHCHKVVREVNKISCFCSCFSLQLTRINPSDTHQTRCCACVSLYEKLNLPSLVLNSGIWSLAECKRLMSNCQRSHVNETDSARLWDGGLRVCDCCVAVGQLLIWGGQSRPRGKPSVCRQMALGLTWSMHVST